MQYRLGSRFTPGVIAILALYTCTFILLQVRPLSSFAERHLLLTPALALGREPYQLLTGPAMMTSFFPLLFVGILLYSIGSAVEERLGTRRFLWWTAGASVAAALAAAALGRLLPPSVFKDLAWAPVAIDGGPVFMMVLMVFAHFYGDLPVRMWGVGQAVSGRALSYFFVGLSLFAELLRGQWPHLLGDLAAVGFAVLMCRGARPTLERIRRRLGQLLRRRRAGFQIQVIDGGLAGAGGKSKKRPSPRYVN